MAHLPRCRMTPLSCPARAGEVGSTRSAYAGRVSWSGWFGANDACPVRMLFVERDRAVLECFPLRPGDGDITFPLHFHRVIEFDRESLPLALFRFQEYRCPHSLDVLLPDLDLG